MKEAINLFTRDNCALADLHRLEVLSLEQLVDHRARDAHMFGGLTDGEATMLEVCTHDRLRMFVAFWPPHHLLDHRCPKIGRLVRAHLCPRHFDGLTSI